MNDQYNIAAPSFRIPANLPRALGLFTSQKGVRHYGGEGYSRKRMVNGNTKHKEENEAFASGLILNMLSNIDYAKDIAIEISIKKQRRMYRNMPKLIKKMIRLGVVKWNPYYCSQEYANKCNAEAEEQGLTNYKKRESQCCSFALTEKYQHGEFIKVPANREIFLKKLKEIEEDDYGQDHSMTDDEYVAKQVDMFKRKVKVIEPEDWCKEAEEEDLDVPSCLNIKTSIEKFKRGNYNYTVSKKVGRHHHVLALMNKKGWKYFFWNDGEPMCRSDFKANHSGIQPALLDKMYPGQVNKKEIQAAHSTGDFYAATCGSKDPDKRNAFKSEVQLYHYASANKRRSCVEYGKTRWKWVKKDRPIDRIMADKYPDYHKMCSNMSKGEKRLMSHINMKVETSIMVDTGKDLMAMGIEEFIQIHDCMMGRYQNRKVTEQRMVGNAQRILDFTMEVKSDEPKFL